MTLGDGIFCSTLLVIFAAAIHQISVRHKWRFVGKLVGALLVIGGVVGGGAFWWEQYSSRPAEVTEFLGLRVGMAPVEVSLAKGEPTVKEDLRWIYREGEDRTEVRFEKKDGATPTVLVICRFGGYESLLGLSRFSSESDMIKRLGEPLHTSINASGLEKLVSYPQWNATFTIAKNQVNGRCAGWGVKFTEEYPSSESPPRADPPLP